MLHCYHNQVYGQSVQGYIRRNLKVKSQEDIPLTRCFQSTKQRFEKAMLHGTIFHEDLQYKWFDIPLRIVDENRSVWHRLKKARWANPKNWNWFWILWKCQRKSMFLYFEMLFKQAPRNITWMHSRTWFELKHSFELNCDDTGDHATLLARTVAFRLKLIICESMLQILRLIYCSTIKSQEQHESYHDQSCRRDRNQPISTILATRLLRYLLFNGNQANKSERAKTCLLCKIRTILPISILSSKTNFSYLEIYSLSF
jgi:hypothetical protein